MKTESDLQFPILKDLESLGKACSFFKIMKASINGFPDIFFSTTISGPVFIETKRFDGEARKLQLLRIGKLNKTGCRAFVCNSWKEWIDIKIKVGISNKKSVFEHYLSFHFRDVS